MYNANNLLSSLVHLGTWLRDEAHLDSEIKRLALAQNGWFSEESVDLALQSLGQSLLAKNVDDWASNYALPSKNSQLNVGLILPGNLPLVGWHDVMCTVISGHQVHVKLSKDDAVLPKWLLAKWATLEPYVEQVVTFHDGLMKDMDAVIATGGSNASRYFESYFGHLPHLFRGPRTSIAWLDGQESDEDLVKLGDDIFSHFGMGCRSVTKVWMPTNFDLDRCFGQWMPWGHLAKHGKYANNYDYHKAIWLLNKEDIIENGFVLVKEDKELVSPIGTLFVERYDMAETAVEDIVRRAADIQVVTTRAESEARSLLASKGLRVTTFGMNQCPAIDDYADGVDTMSFLLSLPTEGRGA